MGLARNGQPKTGLASPVSFGVGLLLLFLAPVVRGGNRHVAMALLECLALVLLALLGARIFSFFFESAEKGQGGARSPASSPITGSILFLALSPVWVGIVQLMPLPPSLWASLPGHETYLTALQAVQMDTHIWRPVSLSPDATWVSILAGLPLMAAFLLAVLVTAGQLAVLVRTVVLIAFLQALIGLLQIGSGRLLYFDAAMVYDRSIGTFANPNHFASFIAMTLPLGIFLLRQALRAGSPPHQIQVNGRQAREVPGRGIFAASFWGAVLFVLAAGLLSSLSRAGIATAAFAAFAAVLLIPLDTLGRRAKLWRAGSALLLCILVFATVGVSSLLGRVAGSGLDPSRLLMAKGTWEGIVTFWPLGSGMGTYAGVFPRFQPPGLRSFVEYAHSDYLQLLMEGGLPFVLLGGLASWIIIRSAVAATRRLRADPSDLGAALMASCGLGVLAVFLHSWVDFNLRIPANAVMACFLLGVFVRLHSQPGPRVLHQAR